MPYTLFYGYNTASAGEVGIMVNDVNILPKYSSWNVVKKVSTTCGTNTITLSTNHLGDLLAVFCNFEVTIYGKNQGGNDNWGIVKAITGQTVGPNIYLSNDVLIAKNVNSARVYIRNHGGIDNWYV